MKTSTKKMSGNLLLAALIALATSSCATHNHRASSAPSTRTINSSAAVFPHQPLGSPWGVR